MKVKLSLNKKESRGGFKGPRSIRNAYSALIGAILDEHGGATAVAKLLGVSNQTPTNWRARSKVPLNDARHVSEALGVPMLALNYDGISRISEKHIPFEDVVRKCKLSKKTTELIIQLYKSEEK